MKNKIFILLSLCTFLTTITMADPSFDPHAAKEKLNPAALQKVMQAGIDLDTLVTNESNDLIIEYEVGEPTIAQDSGQERGRGQGQGQGREQGRGQREERRNRLANQKKNIMSRFNRAGGVQTLRDFNTLPLDLYRVQNREVLVDMLNDPNIKGVYPNKINYPAMAESLPLIHQPEVMANGFTGKGASAVVIDTGVNYRHPDFRCTAINTPTSTCKVIHSFDTAPNDYALDDDGHGSNVAGIISQVAPHTKIISIDVFRKLPYEGQLYNSAYDSDILAAINWAINNAEDYNIKVINLSLGSPGTKYTSECLMSSYRIAFASARSENIIPVVAAGNDGFADGVASPACVAGAVRVGAVYDSNIGPLCTSDSAKASDRVTCFSNGGKLVTFLAPGAVSTAGGYTMGGTSQAAPYVAGAIALLRADSVNSDETIDETIHRLKVTGKSVTDHRTGFIFPRINLYAATNGLTLNR